MKKILIFDVETTSTNEKKGCMVEFGATELDLDTGKAKVVFDSLILEEGFNESHWEYQIMKEKGIEKIPFWAKGWIFSNSDLTPRDVFAAPPASEILPQIQELINKYPNGATAFNNEFDFRFVEYRGIVIPKKLPCIMKALTQTVKAKNKAGRIKWPKAQEAYDYFFPDKPRTELHRGADDSQMEALIAYEAYKIGVFKVD